MELFGTAGIRGPVTELTPKWTLQIGQAVGADICDRADHSTPEVVLARDGRVTGSGLLAAMTAGLSGAGVRVLRAGQLPTPALAYASRDRAGVMLTASHNPPPDNGIKLFSNGREYDREAERRVEARVATASQASWEQWTDPERLDPLPAYRETVAEFASNHGTDPDELSVVVDCGTGMAALATPQVLSTLGADVVALNANVDGHFSARESKPTPETLTDLRSFVADGPASFGIGHDGDADRIVIVDSDGDVVHEDTILALLAEHYTRNSTVGDPVVVTTPNASGRIDERVREAGGRIERVHLGALHEGIADVRAEGTTDTRVVFAAEPWKHIHPDLGEWIDGVASAAILTRLVAETGLSELCEPVNERPYRKESIRCADGHKDDAMAELAETLPETFPEASVDTEYGIRLELPDGSWTLVRPSGTEPYVRIYAESEDVDTLIGTIRAAVETAVTSH